MGRRKLREKICKDCGQMLPRSAFSPGQGRCIECRRLAKRTPKGWEIIQRKERKERMASEGLRPCSRCLGPISLKEPPYALCATCKGIPSWTKESIIDAIRIWAHTHEGKAPSSKDWVKAQEKFPTNTTVKYHFGSWKEGLEAAGFESHRGREPTFIPNGTAFGRLTVIESQHPRYLCRCSCGEEVWVDMGHLKRGNTKSCGCLQKEISSGFKPERWTSEDKQQHRRRAQRHYALRPCQICGLFEKGVNGVHRHHIDNNPENNDPTNIAFLCRKHHDQLHAGTLATKVKSIADKDAKS